MSAWTISQPWDHRFMFGFREVAGSKARSLMNQGIRVTCEDLPLRLTIDFAASRGLPFRIKNGSRTLGYRPEGFGSVDQFRNEVLRTTGARDLLLRGNTIAVGSDQPGRYDNLPLARPGDMIYLQYTDHGHVQFVTHVSDGHVTIAQGNLSQDVGMSESDPSDRYYAGVHVRTFSYDRQADGTWRYSNPGKENVFRDLSGRVRRWDFLDWNPADSASVVRMRGPNESERRRRLLGGVR